MAEITNKLLKEAIADAEAVRETAVANAKLVLEESITPTLRDMIARRLRVEAEMATDTPPMKKEPEATQDEVAKEQPQQDAEPVGSSEMPADSSVIGTTDNKEPSADSFDSSDVGTGPETHGDSPEDWYDDWNESDFDLDEVIKELEEDIAALSGKEEEGEEKGEEEEGEEGMEDEMANPRYEGEEPKDEIPSAQSPEKFVHPQGGLTPEGEDAEKDGMEKTADMEKAMTPAGAAEEPKKDDEEEISLEAILAELEAGEEVDSQHATKAMATELARIKNELAQYKQAVGTLRERLQEVNLLNAKLLFTNKMFRKDSLTNEQKVRIVESFDRATTVREVKLVYAALVENLSAAAKTINSRKKVVTEGLASKVTPSTAPKSETKVIAENTVTRRLQELAGIIS